MSIKKMSTESFPTPTIEEWQEKAEASLKGRKIATLGKMTFENIELKPLYTSEDQDAISQFPAQSDYRRGIHALGYISQGWMVAQKLAIKPDLKESLSAAFTMGQSTISFEVTDSLFSQIKALEDFQEDYPYSLNAKKFHGRFIEAVSELPSASKATGYIGQDPIALLAEWGAEEDNISNRYNDFYNTVKKAISDLPNVSTILVDTTPYHNGGANAVQELATAVSTGVSHIEELSKRGLSLETILSKIVFQFSIGANFFMEIAKLRAARILWSKVAELYSADEEKRGMVISAATSSFTKTVNDPYVNLLRAGNEAFAAVLGGIQYLHVSAFNEPEGNGTDFSERIARNTQLILKEEAHLTMPVDPAGGSWYIEQLTKELAEKAWEQFLVIDEMGGMIEALQQGWLQSEIAQIRVSREEAIATRKQTIVGTNKYADLQGDSLEVNQIECIKQTGFIEPIPQGRLAVSYENLRRKSSQLKQSAVGLITLGSLKTHKARVDFITGFLAPGGIYGVVSGEVNSIDEAKAFIERTNYVHYCFCGSNDAYEELGVESVKQIKEIYPHVQLYLAGFPEDKDAWVKAGITDFIHVKSNCYMTLATLLDEMEAGINE